MAVVLTARRLALGLAIALAATLVACGHSDRPPVPATHVSATSSRTGPDPLLLRVPRTGGPARVVADPAVDSTVWVSTDPLPPLDRVLAFDDDAGTIAFVDLRGWPGRLDLRLGTVTIAARQRLRSPASVSGSTIFGVTANGSVTRMAAAGDWTYRPAKPARLVFPQRDTSILVLVGEGDSTMLLRVRPPLTTAKDSVRLPAVAQSLQTPLGDRVYFTSASGLISVDTRSLKSIGRIGAIRRVAAMAVSPSGDRLYVVSDSSNVIQIVDRYHDKIAGAIRLPRTATDLRVDPLGKYLLARDAARDSVWIIAVGTNRLIGTLRSAWRGDIPFVAPTGSIVTSVGEDVWFIDPVSLRPVAHVPGGSADFWFGFWWTGFRPSTVATGQPVAPDTVNDTASSLAHTSPPLASDTAPTTASAHGTADTIASAPRGFWVEFAAYLVQQRAQDLAAHIHVGDENATIVVGAVSGVPIYRVVLGPFPTREEAEQKAAASGQPSPYVHAGPP